SAAEERPTGPDRGGPSAATENGKAPAAGATDDGSEPATRRDGGPPGSAVVEADTVSSGGDDVERTTVRITSDVGEILGVDDRTYDLVAEDVVTLPATNAEPLLERGVAESLQ
ncbi:hypothetical protein HLRTI_002960, partial [Halorhabdus tiamatea SARL4B]